MVKDHLVILGTGAWGSALYAASVKKEAIACWGRSSSFSLAEALEGKSMALIAVPAQSLRCLFEDMSPYIHQLQGIIFASKGIEKNTGLLPSEIAEQVWAAKRPALAMLAGPNLAFEIQEGKEASVLLATSSVSLRQSFSSFFKGGPLFFSFSEDIMGAQAVSALKNVMAIGYGALQALDVGDNFLASYLGVAFQEMCSFARCLDAQVETFFGPAGLGDFILTCTSPHSRSSRFGRALSLSQCPSSIEFLVEGAFSAPAVLSRAQTFSLTMPVVEGIEKILEGQLSPQQWPSYVKTFFS